MAQQKLVGTDGSRWAVMKRYDIPDLREPSKTYLTRWRVLQTPWFAIYLHRINMPDKDRHLHNHPWNFWSLILRGGYIETWADQNPFVATVRRERLWRGGTVHRLALDEFHSITRLVRVPTWTLLVVGRRQQVWGFATPEGFVDHATYHERLSA